MSTLTWELLTLVESEMAEHIVNLASAGEIVAYSEPQTWIGLCAEHLGNVFQSVMACVAARRLYADGSEREGDIIDEHKDVVDVNFFLVFPISDSVARQIHIGRGLQYHDLLILDAPFGNVAITPGGEAKARASRPARRQCGSRCYGGCQHTPGLCFPVRR